MNIMPVLSRPEGMAPKIGFNPGLGRKRKQEVIIKKSWTSGDSWRVKQPGN